MAELFMAEVAASDWRASAEWYARVLTAALEMIDEANGFALLPAGPARVSVKQGDPRPGTTTLYFRVADLDGELARLAAAGIRPSEPVKTSPEGYRRSILLDPDGQRVGLFEWAG